MKTFQDCAGRTWTVAITFDAVKRVRSMIPGVDLLCLMDGTPPLLTRLETDLELLCNTVYALVKPQAEQLSVSDEAFGQSLGGEAITAAHDAFWQELTDFFRQLRRTEVVKAIQKQLEVVKEAVRAMENRIDQIDVADAIDKHLGKLSGSLPESADLIPVHSRSAS